ncbi:MAG: flavin reductase family protein [Methanosarcinaceae archaeon]|jgi:flavin reductase (DIM6/NTAB) family NADH-FMN oxidoreductase RutF|nr:flavin reductase family protein [Methanosarcinaceae archaeon]
MALHKISYGMYVITSKLDGKLNGQIANVVFQITAEPPTIAISINKQNLTCEFIQKSKSFGVSVLSKDTPLKFIGHFGFRSGRTCDKFIDVDYKIEKNGVLILQDCIVAYLEAEVINTIDAGTHIIFIGKIIINEIINDKEPMTYEYYHEVKRGTTHKNAPTYIKDDAM